MLSFIIPLKSKKVSHDWDRFMTLFQRTLKSVDNQTADAYEILIVGHEKPTFILPVKARFIKVDFAPPVLGEDWETDRHRKETDKARKIMVGYEQTSANTTHIMVVDADDCIHRKIAEFVLNNSKREGVGWYIPKGFCYQEGKKYLFKNTKTFNALCGTCLILSKEHLPDVIEKRPWLYYHHETKTLKGKPLIPLPFAGAVYSMANGENHYMSSGHAKNLLKKSSKKSGAFFVQLFRKLMKYRPYFLTSKIRRDFGLYPIDSAVN